MATNNENTQNTNTEEYNGWTNYETWDVSLWLNNDEGSYAMLREVLEANPDDNKAADTLRDMINDDTANLAADKEIENTMAYDLLTKALSRVNWLEIVENNRDEENEES